MRSTFDKETRTWVPSEVYYAKKAARKPNRRSFMFMPDITPFVSPLSGEELTSRSQVRDHERQYEVRQCGELTSTGDFDTRAQGLRLLEEKQRKDGYR